MRDQDDFIAYHDAKACERERRDKILRTLATDVDCPPEFAGEFDANIEPDAVDGNDDVDEADNGHDDDDGSVHQHNGGNEVDGDDDAQ